MARPSKPWKRRGRKGWWAKIDGQLVKLADTERQAWVELSRILGRPSGRGPRLTVDELVDIWLDHTRRTVKPVTWRNYEFYAMSFSARWGKQVAEDICERHVDVWLDGQEGWDGCRPLASLIVRMCWRHGRRKRYIAVNELADMRGPGIRARKPAAPGDVEKLVEGIVDPEFADLYRFMVAVGCRPGEARTLRLELVDLVGRIAIVDGKKGLREVVLPDAAIEPLRRAMRRHKTGFAFRAKDGEPWTMGGLSGQVRMARGRAKLPDTLVAYHARGDFASRAHAAGADLADIARCLGHNDTDRLAVLFKHYLRDSKDRLRDVAEKASGGVTGGGIAPSDASGSRPRRDRTPRKPPDLKDEP